MSANLNMIEIPLKKQTKQMNRQFAEIRKTNKQKMLRLSLAEKLKLKWDATPTTIGLAKLWSWITPSVDVDVESFL